MSITIKSAFHFKRCVAACFIVKIMAFSACAADIINQLNFKKEGAGWQVVHSSFTVETGALKVVVYDLDSEPVIDEKTDFTAMVNGLAKVVSGLEFDTPSSLPRVLTSQGWLVIKGVEYSSFRAAIVVDKPMKDDVVLNHALNQIAIRVRDGLKGGQERLNQTLSKIDKTIEKQGNKVFIKGFKKLSDKMIIEDKKTVYCYSLNNSAVIDMVIVSVEEKVDEINVLLPKHLATADSRVVFENYKKYFSQKARDDVNSGKTFVKLDRPSIGLAVETKKDDEGFKVRAVLPKSSAAKAGVQIGWTILEVNGKSVQQMSYRELMLEVLDSGKNVKFLFLDPERIPKEMLIDKEVIQ